MSPASHVPLAKNSNLEAEIQCGSYAVWLVGCQSQYHDNKLMQLVIEVKLRN
ncbi:hypothetical protein V0242_03950 [Aeromonas hydrophila]|uniref:hypothetical protein n=1 Tax=Aeromonas hydrophila TaxID=644 RepID=UPI002ED14220|nr:hypothetical protein V0242_03950 [Aeromonas hydrophila]